MTNKHKQQIMDITLRVGLQERNKTGGTNYEFGAIYERKEDKFHFYYAFMYDFETGTQIPHTWTQGDLNRATTEMMVISLGNALTKNGYDCIGDLIEENARKLKLEEEEDLPDVV